MIPRIYAAISAVAAELAREGLAKNHINLEDQYAYRSVDDVYNRIGPLLARHKLCVLPHMLSRSCTERAGPMELMLFHVTVHAAFDLVSAEDGSSHRVEAFGEALDPGDKGTAKAMQSAFKYALLQSFCVPLGPEDADARSLRPRMPVRDPAPAQGWDKWAADVIDMIDACQSPVALGQVQERYRSMLACLSRERSDLYEALGRRMASRRQASAHPQGHGGDNQAPQSGHATTVGGSNGLKGKPRRGRPKQKQAERVDA
jgi:hypothetical protein